MRIKPVTAKFYAYRWYLEDTLTHNDIINDIWMDVLCDCCLGSICGWEFDVQNATKDENCDGQD